MELTEADDDAFLLELLNTRPVIDGVSRDELADRAGGLAWLARHGHPATTSELTSARTAREVLRDLSTAADVSGLASLLRDVVSRPVAGAAGVSWNVVAPRGRTAAVRAALAWDQVRRTRPGRLRECANPDCTLFFIDRSKPNRARWCSMAVCGNRAKARRHYEKERDQRA